MRLTRITGSITMLALAAASLLSFVAFAPSVTSSPPVASTHRGAAPARVERVPHYQHILVIVLENRGYDEIIGNPHARRLNELARAYGLATNYYSVIHPSEPNYVALIGGSSFGITDDAAYTSTWNGVPHTINALSLVDQLEAAHLTWKSYQGSLPYVGYTGGFYPSKQWQLYASKHDPFLNFAHVQYNAAERRNIVPDTQLVPDVQNGRLPNFSFIAPDMCHDMHGEWPTCPLPQRAGDANDQNLVEQSDAYVGYLVRTILTSRVWARGYNAIFITWDENDHNLISSGSVAGCCNANPGGGHVATIVITSYGPRHIRDSAPYNHYALLRTIQTAFRLGCLQNTCDTTHVGLMERLLAVRSGKPSAGKK